MNVFLYAVIPGFILAWWYGAIKALTQRTPETIGDFVFLFVVFIVMPVGYGYFLWKRKQPNKTRQANLEALVNDLCDFARSDNYVYVYVDLSRDPYACSSLYFKTADGNSVNYYFNQHGYAAIRVERIFDVFDALGDRLNGYVIRNYSEFCKSGFYSDDPDNVYLLLGEAAAVERKKREIYENSNMNHKKLKQI
jgi:hypothetical protein|uniref:Uncharacterized protein n=1 Tax=Siphoviridae sp. ctf8W5 TaxID=2825595 RepID=A0A8S5Q7D3_9CAUD|nr:MAG TPA: hypothetical protein [Siphoviridae sp. ctf8W5]